MRAALLPLFFVCLSGASVPVAHNDQNQTGSNVAETVLATANVTAGKFGKLCSASLGSGDVYSQPLYLPQVAISGAAHDTAFLSTMGNNVLAIDVHSCAILWTINVGATWNNYLACCVSPEYFYGHPMGTIGTGVIDPVSLKLYIVNATPTPSHVLNRIDIASGTIDASVTIAGSVLGTGGSSDACATGGVVSFCSVQNQQGTSLVLSPDRSKVYFGFGGWELKTGWHGWMFAYNTAGAMTRAGIFCTTPNGAGAVPWMSRGAPSVDASGNIYVVTGNGDYDGSTSFGECVLKLSSTLSLLAFFVNPNGSSDTTADADFGVNRFLLIPGTTLGVAAGKDFSVYLINTTAMTQVQTFKTNSVTSPGAFTGSYGGAFMNNVLYLPTSTGPLYSFAFSAGTFNASPVYTTAATMGSHNGQLSGSANGASNQILWQVTCATSSFTSNPAGVLRALDALTGIELWNSGGRAADALGLISKFAAPTVADGLVLVPSNSGTLVVYGLLHSSRLRGQAGIRGAAVIR